FAVIFARPMAVTVGTQLGSHEIMGLLGKGGMGEVYRARVEAAHEKSVVHRDLKPANVKIAPDGGVQVPDFGLATADEENSWPRGRRRRALRVYRSVRRQLG